MIHRELCNKVIKLVSKRGLGNWQPFFLDWLRRPETHRHCGVTQLPALDKRIRDTL